ncbi:helix-turn-helix domain-containing protein [Streptomyces sp. NPDC008150]|uniref:helix-turn-helix domain-containing protein n=1 Tax=Streptomyces sp. NPDC008150 TaxID=3364816 RepID=UPI0036EB6797
METTVLSTRQLPKAERFDWWREMVAHSSTPTAVASEHRADFLATSEQTWLGDLRLSAVSFPSMRVSRSPTLVRRCDPERYHLVLPSRGGRWFSWERSNALVREDDLMLYDSSHAYEAHSVTRDSGLSCLMIDIPRGRLPLPTAKIDLLLGRPLSARAGTGFLVAQFLTHLARQVGTLEDSDALRLGTATSDLVTALLAHHLSLSDEVGVDSRERFLLTRVYAFIEEHLGDRGLSPARIAAAHHISVRSLHRFFHREETSVSAWIKHRRLERCRRDLAEPHLLHRPVHTIAEQWGFAHPQSFSRAFSAAYECTPSDYRAGFRPAERAQGGQAAALSAEADSASQREG